MRSRHLCAPSTVRRERSDVEMHAGEKKRSTTNVVMQPTRLESLPNELLLDLCAYLSTGDLVRAFYNANLRFNCLLDVHFQSFGFDCQSTTVPSPSRRTAHRVASIGQRRNTSADRELLRERSDTRSIRSPTITFPVRSLFDGDPEPDTAVRMASTFFSH